HLRRGGRIGAAATLLGSALMVKPLLELREGRLAPLEKVRTSSRALARLEELAVTEAGERRVDLGVQHLAAAGRAESLAARLRDRSPTVRDTYVGEVGPVTGAHVGPGMLGVVVAPLGWVIHNLRAAHGRRGTRPNVGRHEGRRQRPPA